MANNFKPPCLPKSIDTGKAIFLYDSFLLFSRIEINWGIDKMRANFFLYLAKYFGRIYRLRRTIPIYVVTLFVAISCTVASFTLIPDYPITYQRLHLLELEQLNDEYFVANEGKICSTLNEFGFTGFSRILFPDNVNPCTNKPVIRVELTQPDTLVQKAKAALLANANFTNVTDTTDLQLLGRVPLYGCTVCEGPNINSVPIEWKFTFDSQRFGAQQVYNTEITVFVDDLGVNRIWGNWYPDYYAPDLIEIGYLEAKETVKANKIYLSQFTGEDSVLVVTDELITEVPDFIIVPFENEQGDLELRKSWNIVVNYSSGIVKKLYAHVDVFDGRLLQIVSSADNTEYKLYK